MHTHARAHTQKHMKLYMYSNYLITLIGLAVIFVLNR